MLCTDWSTKNDTYYGPVTIDIYSNCIYLSTSFRFKPTENKAIYLQASIKVPCKTLFKIEKLRSD